MIHDLRHRLKHKLMVQRAIQAAITPTKEHLDTIIAKEIAEAALKAKEEVADNSDLFVWHDGRELPVQSLLLDVLYDLIKRDPNIESMSIKMRDDKVLRLSWG